MIKVLIRLLGYKYNYKHIKYFNHKGIAKLYFYRGTCLITNNMSHGLI